ncbi:hypothetical protein C4D60_Mb08t33870 [Musa balbisiana]|uniref:Uncharacterized protein n=1 Tax=Musa balbisiana TaxID=52838 RepID=A0A4S8K8J8_MUSBA|nr:hypothetical protein C4D60_Mb08t33870 [Musa balbisiana]
MRHSAKTSKATNVSKEHGKGHGHLQPLTKNAAKKKPRRHLSVISGVGIIEGGWRWIGKRQDSLASPSSSSAFSLFSLNASSSFTIARLISPDTGLDQRYHLVASGLRTSLLADRYVLPDTDSII